MPLVQKLEQSQVSLLWDSLKEVIKAGYPRKPKNELVWLNNLLSFLLDGRAQVWVGKGESGKVSLVCVTMFIEDPCSDFRQLLIYCLLGGGVSDELWKELSESLFDFGRKHGCDELVAFTSVSRIVEVAKELGWDCSTTLLRRSLW